MHCSQSENIHKPITKTMGPRFESSNCTTNSNNSPTNNNNNGKQPPAKTALRESLQSLNLPLGLLSSTYQNYLSCHSRVWLLDNSSRMKYRDSHVGRGCQTSIVPGAIERLDGGTRWEELQECVAFHTKMASKCWIPTNHWLVNDPTISTKDEWRHSLKIPLCQGTPRDIGTEVRQIERVMNEIVVLEDARCPLRSCVHTLFKGFEREADVIRARDQYVTLVICTQGRVTDKEGEMGTKVMKEFYDELSNFAKMPVRIIVRLCTDTEEVRDIFNSMDGEFDSIDVLDDFWHEAFEVYLHNPWLTYTLGLHRLRESGLAPEMMDAMDERSLTLDEVHRLCIMLFLGEDSSDFDLPHPQMDQNGFLTSLTRLVKEEQPQWTPVKKKMMPWIDLRKLESVYKLGVSMGPPWSTNRRRTEGTRPSSMSLRHSSSGGSGGERPEALLRSSHRAEASLRSSMGVLSETPFRKSSRNVLPHSFHNRPEAKFRSSQRPDPSLRSSQRPDASLRSSVNRPDATFRSSVNRPEASYRSSVNRPEASLRSSFRPFVNRPEPTLKSSIDVPISSLRTSNVPIGPRRHTFTDTQKPSATAKGNDLMSIIQRWSHEPPHYDKMYPLERLLVTAPLIFPPINEKVNPHPYFKQWKFITREALMDEDINELRELLKKALRKTKYFLDPVRFPPDFNRKQELLLKTIGNIIRDQEEATLG